MPTHTTAANTVASAFQALATSAQALEDDYRKQSAAEIARLSAARVTAFRRVRFISLLEQAVHSEGEATAGIAGQQAALCREFGWSQEQPAHKEILDHAEPVCRALAERSATSDPNAVRHALETFETWFQSTRGTSIYTLFDVYVQETPVVDF